MPALPSFMSYRSQLKDKVKSPFSSAKRRLEGTGTQSTSSTPTPLAQSPVVSQEVLDIGDNARDNSMDFYDAGPSPQSEYLNHRTPAPRVSSPPLQLQLDLTSDSEQLSDWFSTSFPRPEPSPLGTKKKPATILEVDSEDDFDNEVLKEEVFEESIEMMPSGQVIANLEAMNASSFGRLQLGSVTPSPKDSPGRIRIPQNQQNLISTFDEDGVSSNKSRPMSQPSSSPLSSAVSGTTLARQLIGNGFSLSHDRRASAASRFRNVTGLTRSDSMTLPQAEYEDRFEVGPDAPPIPHNAENLYVAPKTPRDGVPQLQPRVKSLRRRSSTGSIATPDSDSSVSPFPPLPRPTSALVSPTELNAAFQQFRSSPSPEQDAAPHNSIHPPHDKRHIPPAISVSTAFARDAATILQDAATPPTDASALSPEDVLDYYSTDNPESSGPAQRGFRPVFTPITEESLSQLSPPAPYVRSERRDSQRNQPLGARNPASPRVRSMLSPKRSASESSTCSLPLVLGQVRPPSMSLSASSISVAGSLKSNGSQLSIDTTEPLAPPPPLSTIFNRQRSGSAPSPIKVVRDEDLSQYNISVPRESAGTSPETADSFIQNQEFPETATAPWSAVFSPGVQPTGGAPEVRMSAVLPAAQPNAAQQIMLARATTSARSTHTRQVSLGNSPAGQRPHTAGSAGTGQTSSATLERRPKTAESGKTNPMNGGALDPGASKTPGGPRRGSLSDDPGKAIPPKKPPPKRSLPPSPTGGAEIALKEPLPPIPPLDRGHLPQADTAPSATLSTAATVVRSPSSAASVRSIDSSASASNASLQNSARPSLKSLPPIPPSPTSSSNPSPPSQVTRGPRPRVPQPLHLAESTVPNVTAEGSSPRPEVTLHSIEPRQSPPSHDSPAHEPPAQPLPQSPPLPLQSSQSHKSTNTIDELLRASTALGSPPPYYTVVDQLHPPPMPPLPLATRSNPNPVPAPAPALNTPVTFSNPFGTPPRDASSSRSRLGRPAGPMGPRGPSMQGPGAFGITRDRSGSSASGIPPPPQAPAPASSAVVSPRRPSLLRPTPEAAHPPVSPKFQSPAIRHRGYTMEAAKWTFSSAQLQGIVSKAIRESAQTSSIRLLKLESLETEIPDEIHRLEMQRTDIKSKYKALTKRRATLFESLTFHLNSSSQSDSTFALRVTEELASIATSLDQLTEELHSTDVQLSQLNTLVHVHSSSALSMALRKLNGSFLKQVSETQTLQERVAALEAERDEAWKHAEELANEYDHLHFHPSIDSPGPSSNRSSRVSAKRKSSIRVSKAGLRSQSRRQSARSSVASSAYGQLSAGSPPSSRAHKAEKIPPLPPIPKRRPADIITDYHAPLRSSPLGGPLSMDDGTPNSEARALDRAEEELYSMLGLTVPDSLKRSRSMVGHLPSAGLSPPPVTSAAAASLFRRSSLPGGATLVEAQNAMNADRNAVVFTFEMLRDDDSDSAPQSSVLPYTRF